MISFSLPINKHLFVNFKKFLTFQPNFIPYASTFVLPKKFNHFYPEMLLVSVSKIPKFGSYNLYTGPGLLNYIEDFLY